MPLFPLMDLTFFKDSFSNIRLEIHLGLSQWDHTDTITNISFHYRICRCKWHIYILSAWELDKTAPANWIGMPPRNKSFYGCPKPASASGPSSTHWPCALAAFFQLFYLTAKNADSPAEFPKLWFSIRPKDDKWGFHSRWWAHHENDILVQFFAQRQGKNALEITVSCFCSLSTTVVSQNSKEEQKWMPLLKGCLGVCPWQGHTCQCPGHAFFG